MPGAPYTNLWQLELSSPMLWARIHIPFRVDGYVECLYRGHQFTPSEKVTKALELRCGAVKEWLSRSGNCPLSISISYAPDYSDFDEDSSDDSSMDWPYFCSSEPLLSSITPFASRCRFLELTAPLTVNCELESILSDHPPLNLVHLRASICDWRASASIGGMGALRPSLELFGSPNLQHISVSLLSDNRLLAKSLHQHQKHHSFYLPNLLLRS